MIRPDNEQNGACGPHGEECITCGDVGVVMRVVAVDGDNALCEDDKGSQAWIAVEAVDIAGPVAVGDLLLTHAGAAIGRVDEDREEAA